MSILIVRLPWPDSRLMPNRSKGRAWQGLSKLRHEQRTAGDICTQAAIATTGPQEWEGNIPVSLVFMSPDKRHRDLDNLLAASKPILDGMAQAMGVDDKRFKPLMVDSVYAGGEGCLMAAVGVEMLQGVKV